MGAATTESSSPLMYYLRVGRIERARKKKLERIPDQLFFKCTKSPDHIGVIDLATLLSNVSKGSKIHYHF